MVGLARWFDLPPASISLRSNVRLLGATYLFGLERLCFVGECSCLNSCHLLGHGSIDGRLHKVADERQVHDIGSSLQQRYTADVDLGLAQECERAQSEEWWIGSQLQPQPHRAYDTAKINPDWYFDVRGQVEGHEEMHVFGPVLQSLLPVGARAIRKFDLHVNEIPLRQS